MLELKIRFESSWTNSFYSDHGSFPLFTSGSQLSGSAKGLVTVPFDREATVRSGSRVSYLRDLQAANPQLLYRVPESFDRTVQGVLARLVGEVRRLSSIENDHLALRAFEAGQYAIDIEHEHSQTTKLATNEVNDIQTGGAGLIQNSVLYSDTVESRYLFGHLGLSFTELELSIADVLKPGDGTFGLGWTPGSPAALIERIAALDEVQADVIKAARKSAGKGIYVTPFLGVFRELEMALPEEAKASIDKQTLLMAQGRPAATTIESGGLEGWSVAGAVIAVKVNHLTAVQLESYIRSGALTKNGGVAGLAMTGSVGSITPKDVFKFASGMKAESNRMPYAIGVPVRQANGRPQFVPSGVLKKTGTVTFEIDNEPDLESELQQAIERASVGPFHFGKKGIAYVESLEIS